MAQFTEAQIRLQTCINSSAAGHMGIRKTNLVSAVYEVSKHRRDYRKLQSNTKFDINFSYVFGVYKLILNFRWRYDIIENVTRNILNFKYL